MTEKSYWWTTGGAGDGASTYTRVDLMEVGNILAGASYWEGITPEYRNELAGTVGGANTFNINTGGGIVDGKPYENDASVGVTIPSTTSDERIDRVVIRADWTAQTVRITRIAGTQGASPTAPSVTQTSGSTYDIKLYQVRVNTSGTVTIESDEREWAIVPVDESTIENNAGTLQVKAAGITGTELAQPSVSAVHIADGEVGTAEIATGAVDTAELATDAVTTIKITDDNVTQAKIAAGAVDTTELAADSVDDTKAGNRVPQFYRRQGGSATIWTTFGTTTYTPGAVRMQAGVIRWTGSSASFGNVAVTFPTAFSYAPLVFATAINQGLSVTVTSDSITTTGFILYWRNTEGSSYTAFDSSWLAIGPE